VLCVSCLLLGHDDMVVRATGRMWLRCQHCGRDTSGWTVGKIATSAEQSSPRSRLRPSLFLPHSGTPQVVVLTPHR
jgi:hypothetical protein